MRARTCSLCCWCLLGTSPPQPKVTSSGVPLPTSEGAVAVPRSASMQGGARTLHACCTPSSNTHPLQHNPTATHDEHAAPREGAVQQKMVQQLCSETVIGEHTGIHGHAPAQCTTLYAVLYCKINNHAQSTMHCKQAVRGNCWVAWHTDQDNNTHHHANQQMATGRKILGNTAL